MDRARGAFLKKVCKRQVGTAKAVANAMIEKSELSTEKITAVRVRRWWDGRLADLDNSIIQDALCKALGIESDDPEFKQIIGEMPLAANDALSLREWLKQQAKARRLSVPTLSEIDAPSRGLQPFHAEEDAGAMTWPVGYRLQLTTTTRARCQIMVLNFSEPDGAFVLLYPDASSAHRQHRTGQVVRLPSRASDGAYEIGGPIGWNDLFVIQTEELPALVFELTQSRGALSSEQQARLCFDFRDQEQRGDLLGVQYITYKVVA